MEKIFQLALEDHTIGIKINGIPIIYPRLDRSYKLE